MNNQSNELLEKLTNMAYERSKPFCYGCYKTAPTGRCESCNSDDLMRVTENGCEYGVDWIIKDILSEELTPADMDQAFEESIRECYPETTKVGWMEFDTVTLMMEQDPISWKCAQSEWEDSQLADEQIITFDSGSTYYWVWEVEKMLE
jgi:hypothetical protein